MKIEYKIYIIRNIINNKIYIGKTSYTIEKRFNKHKLNAQNKINRRLYDSMNHHGYDNFKIEEICTCDNNIDANSIEIYYIDYYNSTNPKIGYNMTIGGDGGNTGVYYHKSPYDWWVEKYGKERADEIKKRVYEDVSKKLSEKYTGMSFNERFGDKCEEVRTKLSNTLKRIGHKPPTQYWKDNNHPLLGKHHKKESCEKISRARLGKKYEDIFSEEKTNELKQKHSDNWKNEKNPNYKPPLTNDEKKLFLKYMKENKYLNEISILLDKTEYELRKYLREINIENYTSFRINKNKNILIDNILKNI